MGRWDNIKKTFGEAVERFQDPQAWENAINPQIQEGDENTPAPNLINTAIEKLGLPQEWQQSVADEKRAIQNMPMTMGMGTMGTVGAIDQAASKLGASAAARVAESKALGNTVHVIPDAAERIAQEAARQGKPRWGKLTIK